MGNLLIFVYRHVQTANRPLKRASLDAAIKEWFHPAAGSNAAG